MIVIRHQTRHSPPLSVNAASNGTGSVLLAKDDKLLHTAASRAISSRGCKLRETKDGRKPLKVARRPTLERNPRSAEYPRPLFSPHVCSPVPRFPQAGRFVASLNGGADFTAGSLPRQHQGQHWD